MWIRKAARGSTLLLEHDDGGRDTQVLSALSQLSSIPSCRMSTKLETRSQTLLRTRARC